MAKMTKTALKRHRANLLEILQRLDVKLEHMEDSVLRSDSDTSPDDADEFSADTYNQEFQLGLIENEDEILREVTDALHRMEAGSFGTCEGCEELIPDRRLQVLPYARYCVDCQQKSENGELGEEA